MSPRLLLSLFALAPVFLGPPAHAAAPPGIGGEYTAIVNGATFDTSGKVRIVLTRGGVGSVSLMVGDEPPCVVVGWADPISGSFIIRGGDADMQVHLVFVPNPDGIPTVTGDIEDDGEVFPVEATQAPSSSGPATGAHTFALGTKSTSADLGTGSARVTRQGRVTGVLHVGQHKVVTFGGRLNADHKLPLAVRFGASESSFTGDISFAEVSTGGTATLHDDEVSTPAFSWRANYHPRTRALEGAAGTYSLVAKLNDSFSGTATQLNSGAIVHATFEGQPATFRLNRATGIITGRTKAHTLRGVVLQDLDVLTGLCDGSGEFNISSDGAAGSGAGASAGLIKTGSGNLTVTGPGSYAGAVTDLVSDFSVTNSGSFTSSTFGSDISLTGGTLTSDVSAGATLVLGSGSSISGGSFTLITNAGAPATIQVAGQNLILNTVYVPPISLPVTSVRVDSTDITMAPPPTILPPPGYVIVDGQAVIPPPGYFSVLPGVSIGGTLQLTGSLTLLASPVTIPPPSSQGGN